MKTKQFILMMLVMLMSVTAWAQSQEYTTTIQYEASWKLKIDDGATDIIITGGTVTEHQYDRRTKKGSITFSTSSPTTSIKPKAFEWNVDLLSITIPETVTTIGDNAFYFCNNLSSVTLPESLKSIGYQAFHACSRLSSVKLPEGLTSIGNEAFRACGDLSSVTLPESLESIGEYAFWDCVSLTSITLPKGLTTIANATFCDCRDLSSVSLPESLTSIGEYAFQRCSKLTSVTLPEGLTSIGSGVFEGCTKLSSIILPGSLTSIGGEAFSDCSGLEGIIALRSTPPTTNSNAFQYVPTTIPVYIPYGSTNAYKTAEGWKDFTKFEEVIDNKKYLVLVSSDESLGKVEGTGMSEGIGMYESGAKVTITAIPEAGCQFTGWSDGNKDNPREYTVTGDAILIANFQTIVYEHPTGPGMRLKVTKKDGKVYEFKTSDVESVEYYKVNE